MTDKTQPLALMLAEQYDYGDPVAHSNTWKAAVCTELRSQHARIAELEARVQELGAMARENRSRRIVELEAQLDSIRAGGGQALSAAPAAQPTPLGADGYPPLPTTYYLAGGVVRTWDEGQMRDFADRTHALRMEQAATKAAPGEPYQDSTPHLSVGDSSFEGWYESYCPAHKADKQRARDAYAAGMGDPLVRAAPQPAPAPLSEQDEREAVARAIWELMREHEDRCDMELDDLMEDHPIWSYADAACAALAAQGGKV